MQNSEQHYPKQRAHHTHDETARYNSYADELPARSTPTILLIGLIAGVAGALVNIIITFLGSPLYQQVAREPRHTTPTGADYAVAVLSYCLGFFIILLFCFLAGFSAGKRMLLRKFGFYAGALAGMVMFLCSFLVRYIPAYPGNMTTQGAIDVATFSRGLIVSLVFLLIWALIGGLMGLWGAGRATRKHPRYLPHEEEAG